MNKDYNIRLALDSDLKTIANLDKAVNLTYWNINQYKECLADKTQRIYVLELNGQISGALAVGIIDDAADILQLWIKRSCQGQGWAGRLFSSVLSELKEQYLLKKVLLEVRENNQPAIKLYRNLGFTVINNRPDYYIITGVAYDALIMSYQIISA